MELTDSVLWITRFLADETEEEVASIGFSGDAARGTFEHARRVFRNVAQGAAALSAGDLIVTLLEDGGVSSADDVDPLRVPANQAEWFLDTWLKIPREWREDLA